ncbi:hypothetical protein APE_2292.1 [Aeropyrum pernix K1]|uniref:Uncharacterized protein n=1 Tax=Aeropyrum pernix (strain ATCC 700893 / DSM 11879 / JCM 9820 / NBRC 100138 / K1) TaxID=272557 RepID=Q9Y9J6_AERPE|nr:hypothetical protein [Aeropyrum pernix]BAA81304.2 hypothetical protein APE_2292.1 [Aeropyrum pernix K1]
MKGSLKLVALLGVMTIILLAPLSSLEAVGSPASLSFEDPTGDVNYFATENILDASSGDVKRVSVKLDPNTGDFTIVVVAEGSIPEPGPVEERENLFIFVTLDLTIEAYRGEDGWASIQASVTDMYMPGAGRQTMAAATVEFEGGSYTFMATTPEASDNAYILNFTFDTTITSGIDEILSNADTLDVYGFFAIGVFDATMSPVQTIEDQLDFSVGGGGEETGTTTYTGIPVTDTYTETEEPSEDEPFYSLLQTNSTSVSVEITRIEGIKIEAITTEDGMVEISYSVEVSGVSSGAHHVGLAIEVFVSGEFATSQAVNTMIGPDISALYDDNLADGYRQEMSFTLPGGIGSIEGVISMEPINPGDWSEWVYTMKLTRKVPSNSPDLSAVERSLLRGEISEGDIEAKVVAIAFEDASEEKYAVDIETVPVKISLTLGGEAPSDGGGEVTATETGQTGITGTTEPKTETSTPRQTTKTGGGGEETTTGGEEAGEKGVSGYRDNSGRPVISVIAAAVAVIVLGGIGLFLLTRR